MIQFDEEEAEELRRIWDDPTPIELPPPMPGLSADHILPRQVIVKLDQPTHAALVDLLVWLPPERRLSFWDIYYPQLTDPGAGVSVQSDGYRLYYQLGNHGWSSRWSVQSPELIAAWILLNVDAPSPYEPMTQLTLSRAPRFRSRWITG